MRPSSYQPAYQIGVTISPRSIWLTFALIAGLVALAYIVSKTLEVLILFFIAIVFAEGIRPIVTWIHEKLRVPLWAAVLLLYLVILATLVGLAWLVAQPLIAQFATLTANLPHYMQTVQQTVSNLQRRLDQSNQLSNVFSSLQSTLGNFAPQVALLLVRVPLFLGEALGGTLIIIFMAFFWLTGVSRLKPFVISLFPEPYQEPASSTLTEMGMKIGGYLRGVVVNMVVIGVLSGLGDFFLGAPYPILLGLIAGVTELIPYLGPWISGGIAVLITLVVGQPIVALELVGLYILIQEFEGHVLSPQVMNRAVDLNPLTVIITVLMGTALLGFVGGILAVPFSAAVKVLTLRVLAPAARRASAHLAPRRPYPLAPSPAHAGEEELQAH